MNKLLIVVVLVVLAGGVAYYLSAQEAPAPPPPAGEPVPTPSSSPVSIEGWKTYRNEQYGFEVKYPGEWNVEMFSTGLRFGTKPTQYNYLDVEDSNGFLDVRRDELWDYGHGAPGPKIREEITIVGGVNAEKQIYEGDGFESVTYPLTREVIYRFNRGDRYYYVQFTAVSQNRAMWERFETMIQSFRFLR